MKTLPSISFPPHPTILGTSFFLSLPLLRRILPSSFSPLFISFRPLSFSSSASIGNDSRGVSSRVHPPLGQPKSITGSGCSEPLAMGIPGDIHVIIGPMFAGKTTALLRRIQAERDSGRQVAVIKSDKDTRYDHYSIVTHDGVKMPCWSLPDLTTFRTKLGGEAYRKLDVIGIDEAQFFEDLYDFCQTAADRDGKTVIVAGLDGDYLRRSFGHVLDIVPLAETVTKLKARCELCGKQASFTLRKSGETQTELIGGADVYMPVCRQHYVNGQVIIEATRTILDSQPIYGPYIEAAPVSS